MRKLLLTILLLGIGLTGSLPVMAEDKLNIFPKEGFYADFRYRYEHVEQDNFINNADASTLRAKIGYVTNPFYNFTAGIEFELVEQLGADEYNSTVNGLTTYPAIADPVSEELNHFWLSYSGLPDTVFKVGRQPINLDNQRFIGTVGWRQNDQTYDAALIVNKSISQTELLYAHVRNVNRIFGDDHPLGDLNTETHIAHITHHYADWLDITGYGYWLDIDESAGLSSKTYGLRLTGKRPMNDDWQFSYVAEIAEQAGHGNNPANYDATYHHVSPGVTWQNLTLQAGWESLEGDGTNAFQTPLATLHAHNGWADKFLTIPVNGLEDLYGKIGYRFESTSPWLDGVSLTGIYHEFRAENGGADYGHEWDFQISRPLPMPDFSDSASIALKYADYEANDFSADTQKFWLTFQVKF